MNIFHTSDDPRECALALDDLRVNKMIIETAQLLCTALRLAGVEDERLYRITHQNHPSAIWARETRANFDWLVQHAIALCDVYTEVREREHATRDVIIECRNHRQVIRSGALTPFANCSMIKHDRISTVRSYQLTMDIKWEFDVRKPTWIGRGPPTWSKYYNA